MTMDRRVTSTATTNLAIAGLTALTGLFIARVLGPEDRGIFAVAFTWFGLTLALGELGTSAAVTVLVARSPDERGTILQAARHVLGSLGLVSGAVLALGSILVLGTESLYLPALLGFAALTPVAFLAGVPSFALQSIDIHQWNLGRVGQPLVYFLAAALLAATIGLTVSGAVAAYSLATVLTLAFTYFLLHRTARVVRLPGAAVGADAPGEHRGTVARHRRAIMNYGMRNFWSSIPNAAFAKLDIIVLGVFAAPAAIGEYAVASTFAGMALPAAAAYANLVLPRLAAVERTAPVVELRRIGRQAILGSAAFAAAVSLALGLCAPWLTARILGPEYVYAGLIATVLCLAQPGRAMALVGRNVLRGLDAPGRAALPEWLSFAGYGALLLVATPPFGVWGAAVATVVAACVASLAYAVAIRAALRHRARHTVVLDEPGAYPSGPKLVFPPTASSDEGR